MSLPRRLCSLAFFAFGLISASWPGFAATTISLSSDKPSIAYGQYFVLTLHVVTDVTTCPGSGGWGHVSLEHDGVTVPSSYGWYSSHTSQSCADGVYTADIVTDDYDLPFGTHVITVTYVPPNSTAAPVRSNAVSVVVNAPSTAMTAAGLVSAGIMDPTPGTVPGGYCTAKSVQVSPTSSLAPPPGNDTATGVVEYQASGCGFDCGFLCPGGLPPAQLPQRMLLQMPQPIPAGAKFWVYSTGPGTNPGWQPLYAQIDGANATLFVTGGPGQTVLSGFVAMSSGVPNVQDMWWAGEAENGWGLSIAQSGNDLFMGLFIFRDDGTPEWLVLSGGSWDAQTHSYSGPLYQPSGSWFGQYDTAAFKPGTPVGQATLTFTNDATATLDYTIRGVSGRKSIQRLPFGSTQSPPPQGEHAGLWWAGLSRTGWGLAIGHQLNTLFSVWYTYAKDGSTTWYVMPGGKWTSTDTYSGPLYRANGSSWLSGAYDVSAFKATPVGAMTIHFTGPGTGTMSYDVDGTSGTESISLQPF